MSKLKILFVLLVIIYSAGLTNAQYLNETKLLNKTGSLTDTTKKKIKLTEKSPLLAGSLSFFLPGLFLGQLYNKDYTSFGIHLGISAVIFSFNYVAAQYKLYEVNINISGSSSSKEGKNEWIPVVCVLTYIGNWLWSTIDAFHVATMNKRELERQRKIGYRNIRLMFSPGIGRNNKPNFNISVCF